MLIVYSWCLDSGFATKGAFTRVFDALWRRSLDNKRVRYGRGGGDPFLISEELVLLAPKLVAALGREPLTGIVPAASYYPAELRVPGIEDSSGAYDALNSGSGELQHDVRRAPRQHRPLRRATDPPQVFAREPICIAQGCLSASRDRRNSASLLSVVSAGGFCGGFYVEGRGHRLVVWDQLRRICAIRTVIAFGSTQGDS